MAIKYSKQVDEKWQDIWQKNKTYKFDENSKKQKLYLLEMFSYPSASNLHLGHWWNYSLPDSWGRIKRMQGYNVFHPMGFDAFGLPAENFAIKTGIHPKDSTEKNIRTMETQLRKIGASYDWEYELKTCDPSYYKWTQWLFIQLYKNGLAYRKDALVNWCSDCNTVLANEQVIDGSCERCHSVIVRKKMTQWFFKITNYIDELISGLDNLDWPEKTKIIQKNWIGKSQGAEITFKVKNSNKNITVFTTRADTLMGLTYVVLSPENELVPLLTTKECKENVESYCKQAALLDEIQRLSTEKEKTGVFTGSYIIHPITNQELPIWVGDYVINSYGTGAVMAVPGHDERDYEFAKKYSLPIIKVIIEDSGKDVELPYCEYGRLINSGKYSNLTTLEAMDCIVDDLAKENAGRRCVTSRLRDWSVSRQRYWGAPIPMIHCPKCGIVPVPEKDLPVELPYNIKFMPSGKSPLADCDEFVNVKCPICGESAKRETDTLDTFVCSSWYHLRYLDNKNDKEAWNIDKQKKFMPVDKYIGGIEHAAMHLLYARFFYKALRDMGYVEGDEPFISLVHQGIILGEDGQKMSKSLGNTVSPDDYIEKFGSDVFRTYLAFGFSYTSGGPWSDNGLLAIDKFFGKIARIIESYLELKDNNSYIENKDLEYVRHNSIKAITDDAERFQFNTCIARLMEFSTALAQYQANIPRSKKYEKEAIVDFTKLLAPFAPHFSEEIWEILGEKDSIFNSSWCIFNVEKTKKSNIEIVVQINGSIKDRIVISATNTEDEIKKIALSRENIIQAINGKAVKKIIVIKARLVNIVV